MLRLGADNQQLRTTGILAGLLVVAVALGLSGQAWAMQPTTQPTTMPTSAPSAQEVLEQQLPAPDTYYGLWVLLPPLAAIALTIVTRQVIAALFVGMIVAAYMLMPVSTEHADTFFLFRGFRIGIEHFLIGAIKDVDHIQVIVFTLSIGAMVGVLGANGGTRSVVDVLSRWAGTSRRAQFTGWLGGHAIFFDDYANTMILGPTMRPLFDRLRISRAKLAYIVDSTAAPVASLAPIGAWIGAEIGFIGDGLDKVREAAQTAGTAIPEFINETNGYAVFMASIGYRFYAILALAMVLIIALTRRDFGPMKKAERRALEQGAGAEEAPQEDGPKGAWWLAFLPVATMVTVTVIILGVTGYAGFPEEETLKASTLQYLLKDADAYGSILYGALAGLILSVLLSMATRTLSLRKAADAGLDGMTRMFPAIVILVLAWSLSQATKSLELGKVVSDHLEQASFQAAFLPMAVFGAACLVSFATGSSWGTMGILCPAAVEIAARLCAGLDDATAIPLFHSTVGAVLAGAIFGDHCSPISDTTVLSAIATDCKLEEHVWTQIPYALTAAAVSVLAGNVVCNIYGYPWWVGIAAGIAGLILIVFVVGRTSPRPTELPDQAQ